MALIQLKRSSTAGLVPLASELEAGELAINTADLELYAEDSVGSVVPVSRPAYPSVKPRSGAYQCGIVVNNSLTTRQMTADRAYWYPWVCGRTVTVDRASIWVMTAVSSSLARIGLYASDADGWPAGSALYTSGDLNCATTGEKFDSASLTFRRGEQYWSVVHSSSTQTLRAVLRTEMVVIEPNPNTAYPASQIYNSQTFSVGLPSTGSYTLENGNIPLVYWRTA